MIDGGNEDYKIIMMMIKWRGRFRAMANRFRFYIKLSEIERLLTCTSDEDSGVLGGRRQGRGER